MAAVSYTHLDEATAYADPENEEKMEAAIAELVKGKTLIVIAHKLPAIQDLKKCLSNLNHQQERKLLNFD